MRKVRRWLLVVAVALVGATALSTPAIAAPAATPNAVVTGPGTHGHVCDKLGDDIGVPGALPSQGVVCADLVVTALQGGGYGVQAVAEGLCQELEDKSKYPRCSNVLLWIGLEDPSGGVTVIGQCGHASGPCSTPRHYFQGDGELVPDGGCHHNVWATVFFFFDNVNTSIFLPGSNREVFMDNNLSTPHFNIGNGC